MNEQATTRTFIRASMMGLATLVTSMAAQAQTCDPATGARCAAVKHYLGTDQNWFNPANWSSGTVPTVRDDVILDGDDTVIIDPLRGQAEVRVNRLLLRDTAKLETHAGTVLHVGTQKVIDQARVQLRGSASVGGRLVLSSTAPGCAGCLNPSTKDFRDVVINTKAQLQMGLGGRQPAALRSGRAGHAALQSGPGHYATLNADTLRIRGSLQLSLHYGFVPQPGDSFQILNVRQSLQGRFAGLPEGGYAGCTADNLGLRISYSAGDGNDVAITAEPLHPGVCLLLPAIKTVGAAVADLAAPVTNGVQQTREHVFLGNPPPPPPPPTGQTREHIFLGL